MNAVSIATAELETIRFACGPAWLGELLVDTSGKGVAAILIGDDRLKLRRDLAAAFPNARIEADEPGLRDVLCKVSLFLEAPDRGLDLPLDIRGNEQERAVWEALRAIPSGEIVTYGQLAKTLPAPATAQEVGAACAANVLAVAIPCHRVVKADGSISGYRWGVWRKKKLINREAMA
jgi:AraC family transcriptional regulator of adaptative response/methylated-DNA-[protein]-cysteine methyltransferase